MKINNQINFIEISKSASSLYSLMADGQYRNTSLGRDKWKSVVGPDASLQLNCNMEGFNAECTMTGRSKARIGILGNEGADGCHSCNSRIGFGTGGDHDDSNTCGNDARFGGDNGDQRIKAMGYILVQWKGTTFNTHYMFVQGAKKTNRYVSFELFGHHQYWPEMWKNGSILRSLLKDMQFTVHER